MLTPEQVKFYKDNGYLIVPKMFEPELVEELRREGEATVARARSGGGDPNAMWKGQFVSDEERQKMVINGIHDMQFQSAAFGRTLYHPNLLDAVEPLIGPNIQLHHTKLFIKPPEKGGMFPMHQDYHYFPHQKHSMLAVIVYLDDTDESNGCVRIIPGSHKLGVLDLAADPTKKYLPPDKYPLEAGVPCIAQAGDALIFSYLTIHGSGPNTSARPRRTILYQLRDPADPPTKQVHLSRGQGMMLRGINPTVLPPTWAEAKAA